MVFTICFGSWGLTSSTAEDFVHSSPWHPRPVGQPRLPEFGPTESDFAKSLIFLLCFLQRARLGGMKVFEIFESHKNKTREQRCVDALLLLLSPCLDQAFLLRRSFLARSKMIKAEYEKKGMTMSDNVIKRLKT